MLVTIVVTVLVTLLWSVAVIAEDESRFRFHPSPGTVYTCVTEVDISERRVLDLFDGFLPVGGGVFMYVGSGRRTFDQEDWSETLTSRHTITVQDRGFALNCQPIASRGLAPIIDCDDRIRRLIAGSSVTLDLDSSGCPVAVRSDPETMLMPLFESDSLDQSMGFATPSDSVLLHALACAWYRRSGQWLDRPVVTGAVEATIESLVVAYPVVCTLTVYCLSRIGDEVDHNGRRLHKIASAYDTDANGLDSVFGTSFWDIAPAEWMPLEGHDSVAASGWEESYVDPLSMHVYERRTQRQYRHLVGETVVRGITQNARYRVIDVATVSRFEFGDDE